MLASAGVSSSENSDGKISVVLRVPENWISRRSTSA
jgi:hypothetical protein